MDFMREHGVSPNHITKLRADNLTAEEWWTEGRTIWWRQDAAERVADRMKAEAKAEAVAVVDEDETDEPSDEDVTITVLIIKPARNKCYAYAGLDGDRIAVRCRARDRARIIGKRVMVKVTDIGGVKFYEHQP